MALVASGSWHTLPPERDECPPLFVQTQIDLNALRATNDGDPAFAAASAADATDPLARVMLQGIRTLELVMARERWSATGSAAQDAQEYLRAVREYQERYGGTAHSLSDAEMRQPSRVYYRCMSRLLSLNDAELILTQLGGDEATLTQLPRDSSVLLDRGGSDRFLWDKFRVDGVNDFRWRSQLIPINASGSGSDPYGDAMQGSGLDPSRHWGVDLSLPTRPLTACCQRPLDSAGCWTALVPDNDYGQVRPYKMWWDAPTLSVWRALEDGVIREVKAEAIAQWMRNNMIVGTAFQSPVYYRTLHQAIQRLAAEVAPKLARIMVDQLLPALLRRVEIDAHQLVDAKTMSELCSLVDSVVLFNAPQTVDYESPAATKERWYGFVDNVIFQMAAGRSVHGALRSMYEVVLPDGTLIELLRPGLLNGADVQRLQRDAEQHIPATARELRPLLAALQEALNIKTALELAITDATTRLPGTSALFDQYREQVRALTLVIQQAQGRINQRIRDDATFDVPTATRGMTRATQVAQDAARALPDEVERVLDLMDREERERAARARAAEEERAAEVERARRFAEEEAQRLRQAGADAFRVLAAALSNVRNDNAWAQGRGALALLPGHVPGWTTQQIQDVYDQSRAILPESAALSDDWDRFSADMYSAYVSDDPTADLQSAANRLRGVRNVLNSRGQPRVLVVDVFIELQNRGTQDMQTSEKIAQVVPFVDDRVKLLLQGDASCPFDALMFVLFKIPNLYFQRMIRSAREMRTSPLKPECGVQNANAIHETLLDEISFMEDQRSGVAGRKCTLPFIWEKCFVRDPNFARGGDSLIMLNDLSEFYDGAMLTAFPDDERIIVEQNTAVIVMPVMGRNIRADEYINKGQFRLHGALLFNGVDPALQFREGGEELGLAHWIGAVRDPSTDQWWVYDGIGSKWANVPRTADGGVPAELQSAGIRGFYTRAYIYLRADEVDALPRVLQQQPQETWSSKEAPGFVVTNPALVKFAASKRWDDLALQLPGKMPDKDVDEYRVVVDMFVIYKRNSELVVNIQQSLREEARNDPAIMAAALYALDRYLADDADTQTDIRRALIFMGPEVVQRLTQ